jgi:transcriptional regulator with XRE-family HTH domain
MARRKRRPPMSEETRGERIKRYRLAIPLSQPELAARLSVSLATVSRWETANRMPQRVHRIPLAEALGTTWAVLAHGAEGVDQGVGLRPGVERRTARLASLRRAVARAQAGGNEILDELIRAAVDVVERHRLM